MSLIKHNNHIWNKQGDYLSLGSVFGSLAKASACCCWSRLRLHHFCWNKSYINTLANQEKKYVFKYLLSPHADRHAGNISVSFLFFSLSAGCLATDTSGVGWRRAMKFCRMVDLRVRQVISPFGELWLRG